MSLSEAPALGVESAPRRGADVPARVAVGTLIRPGSWTPALERRLARVSLAGLTLCGAIAVLCARATAILSPDSVRPLPDGLAGPLSGLGPDLHLGGVIAVFTVMCLCYGALVRLGGRLSARAIVVTVVGIHVLMLCGPPLLSTDVFSYGEYGRMSALYHFDPYVYTPYAILHDAWYPFIGARWVLTPTAYGPLFTALSAALAHLSIGAAALVYKLLAVGGSLLAITGTAVAARRLGRDPMRAVLLVGLNPVLLVYAVGGAHNDMLMLAGVAWAVVLLVGDRPAGAGGLLVAAVAVKLTAAIMLPFALVRDGGPRSTPTATAAVPAAVPPIRWRISPTRRQISPGARSLLTGGLLAFASIGALSAALFGLGPLHLLGTLQQIQGNGGAQSVPGILASAVGLSLDVPAKLGLQAGLVATVVGLLVAVRRGRMDWLTATGWAIVAMLLTSTFLLPWYVAWLLPFAALSSSRSLHAACLALTAIGMTSL